MSRRLAASIAVGAVLVLGIAVPVVVLDRDASPAPARTPALSAPERTVLVADHQLVEALSSAFAELPQVAADVAGTDLAYARRVLRGIRAFAPLVAAADGKSAAVDSVVSGYRSYVASGHASADGFSDALDTVQAIEGDLLPAVRVVALRAGRRLSPSDAVTAVEHDPRARAVAELIAGWSQVYGVLVLVEQAAEAG